MDRERVSLQETVMRALAEDLGGEVRATADVTTRLAIVDDLAASAVVRSKARGVIAGVDCALAAFRAVDPEIAVEVLRGDGQLVEPGQFVLRASGSMRSLLAAERTVLNFLQQLSGVATLTRRFVDAVAGTGARILDTRKTTPGLRALEKGAVVAGGGTNHRFGLHDQVLLKNNHFDCARPEPVETVVRRCVEGQKRPVVAEARDVGEAVAAVRGGAAVVLLDNFEPGERLRSAIAEVRSAAAAAGREVAIEASGGIRLDNVRTFAECGVDRISVGALTHSAPALDLSMAIEVAS